MSFLLRLIYHLAHTDPLLSSKRQEVFFPTIIIGVFCEIGQTDYFLIPKRKTSGHRRLLCISYYTTSLLDRGYTSPSQQIFIELPAIVL